MLMIINLMLLNNSNVNHVRQLGFCITINNELDQEKRGES